MALFASVQSRIEKSEATVFVAVVSVLRTLVLNHPRRMNFFSKKMKKLV